MYRNTMDIAMTDPYPVPGPLDIVEGFVKQLNRDYNHEKSIWLVPQAFGGQELWGREPTAKEIRLMTYLGLINGVKGIQYYTHSLGNLNPQSVSAWSVCSDIAVEVNQISAFLLSDEMPIAVNSADSNVLVQSFIHNNDTLIIAVNRENKPKVFNLQLPTTTSSTASLWFENREVAMHNGRIEDIIDAQGTRVYLLKGKAPAGLAKLYSGNLTANPSFEKIVSPGLPIGSNTKKSFADKTEQGASFFADPRQSVDGAFSLRLITPVDSTGDKIRLLPIVIKANNSYNVSIWAKAKPQEKMPVFRINIEGPGKDKTFTLTNEWKQYNFIFSKDSSYANAILTLELLTAGTAWFDMVQVTPDPRISYSINKDNTANVSIATDVDGATIKYIVTDSKNDSIKTIYKQPFAVSKATTIKAGLFVTDKQVAASGIFIPVNKALNKPVVLQSEYAPQYAASGSASITDGLMASTAFKDNKWLGFSGRDVIATIDMQQATSINSVKINFLDDPNSGIYLPPKISVFVSDNGKDFSLAGTYTNTEVPKMGEPNLRLITIDHIKAKAKYIRIVANAFGEIPEGYLFKGTMSWIFVDEIMVD
ncbi:MAG: carbohydrate binding domain-containing protein [Ferruginibacter sp.]